jgi:hypothetical protein
MEADNSQLPLSPKDESQKQRKPPRLSRDKESDSRDIPILHGKKKKKRPKKKKTENQSKHATERETASYVPI